MTQNMSKTKSRHAYDYDYLIKLVVVGDSGVGKSQLVSRFTRNEFENRSRQTIGVEFATKTIIVNNKHICTQIWDTAGEERYRALASAYYRGAIGVLLVYDVTNPKSFQNIAHWLSEVRAFTPEDCQIILVGNKIDLKATRQIELARGKALAEANKMKHIETSALESSNVTRSFNALVEDVYWKTIATSPATRTNFIHGGSLSKTEQSSEKEPTCCLSGS